MLDWQQVVRSESVIAQCKLRCSLYFESRSVSVIQLWRCVDQELALEIELGRPPESFTQNSGFNLQLMSIVRVLVVASSAALKIRARWLNAVSRRLKHLLNPASRESGLLLGQGDLGLLAIEYKRNENTLARATIVGWEAGETISAVD